MKAIARLVPGRLKNALLRQWGVPTFLPAYDEDGLFTNHNADFTRDERFVRAYAKCFETGSSQGWHWRWRVHVLLWAASIARQVPGDFVECGTYLGGGAAAIVEFLRFGLLDKTFYLFDTFTGLPEDDRQRHQYIEADYFERVAQTFRGSTNIRLVKGVLPGSLAQAPLQKVSFLHIDCGVPHTEIGSLRVLWGRVAPGGIVILNTYAYPGYEDCKREFDKFAQECGIQILSSPTGQGVILKR